MSVDGDIALDRPDPLLQDSLVSVNEPDPMAAEQTWPTDEEIRDAESTRCSYLPKSSMEVK